MAEDYRITITNLNGKKGTERSDEDASDIMTILLATDCHVGFMEKDPVRGKDSFNTFEEILKEAVKHDVDFILLGGDLFHDNKPSQKTLHQTLFLLRKYCMGNKPCQLEFLSDQSINFRHSKFSNVNYEDPNLNIAYPVFSIHGNHDDPTGENGLSAIDLVSVSGLLNHFGKPVSVDKIELSPVLLQKGKTKLALYGLGSVRDERLHKTFCRKNVSMLRPKEDADTWFNILVLHQNRAKHGKTNHIPEHFLDEFLDLVVWGHEHECLIDPDWSTSGKPFYVTQPGSSIATSLAEGESKPKHIGLLKIKERNFKLEKIPLKTVRPFIIDEVILKNTSVEPRCEDELISFLNEKVESMISKVPDNEKMLPLIRLRVEYSGNFEPINPHRFGQRFVKRVANSKDILMFYRKRAPNVKGEKKEDEDEKGFNLQIDEADGLKMEDIIKDLLTNSDQSLQLNVLSEKKMGKAIREFVEKDENDAISELVKWQLRGVQDELFKKNAREDNFNEIITSMHDTRLVNDEEEDEEIEKILASSRRKPKITEPADIDVDDMVSDDNNDETVNQKNSKRGRGSRGRASSSGRGRGSRSRGRGSRGRGRGAAVKNSLDSFVVVNQERKKTKREATGSDDEEYDSNISMSTVSRTKKFQSSRQHLSLNVESDEEHESDDDPFVKLFGDAARR